MISCAGPRGLNFIQCFDPRSVLCQCTCITISLEIGKRVDRSGTGSAGTLVRTIVQNITGFEESHIVAEEVITSKD